MAELEIVARLHRRAERGRLPSPTGSIARQRPGSAYVALFISPGAARAGTFLVSGASGLALAAVSKWTFLMRARPLEAVVPLVARCRTRDETRVRSPTRS